MHTAIGLWFGKPCCGWGGCAAEQLEPTAQTLWREWVWERVSEWVSERVSEWQLHLHPRERKAWHRRQVSAGEPEWGPAATGQELHPHPNCSLSGTTSPLCWWSELTPQIGRRAGATVVSMNNWTDPLEAPITSKKSFIETRVQLNKTDDFGT